MGIKRNKIMVMYNDLCKLYTLESVGSVNSVFVAALKDRVITIEEFEEARKYFGSMWDVYQSLFSYFTVGPGSSIN